MNALTPTRKRGLPALDNPRKVALVLDSKTIEIVEDFRAMHRPILSFSAALRILVEKGSKAS